MNPWELAAGLAGGIGLFLLGMELMTDGLKLAAGPALSQWLTRATHSRGRALATGVAVTALVQSSSAVTVATIGFVNAGLLTLGQSLWVLFGANVGTTMTGWLVAAIGLKLKVEGLALPLVGLGMVLRLTGAGQRRGALGQALAGFGLLFIGIGVLQQAFTGVAAQAQLPSGTGIGPLLLQLAGGVLLTVLMQSSSAALTVALSAAAGGLLTVQGAAAVVIGANLGTTVTAVLAALGATANARRAAAAHVAFNALTGVVALALLPWLLTALDLLRQALGLAENPALKLALFHTVFNIGGVLLMWPLSDRLTRFLQARWHAQDEDAARPQFIDRNLLGVPTLALDAAQRELARLLQGIAAQLSSWLGAAPDARDPAATAAGLQAAEALRREIATFVVQIGRAGMSAASAQRLPDLLRVARHAEAAASAAREALRLHDTLPSPFHPAQALHAALAAWLRQAAADDPATRALASEDSLRPALQAAYEAHKAELLQAAAQGATALADTDAALAHASALNRALEQWLLARQWLRQAQGGRATALESAGPAGGVD